MCGFWPILTPRTLPQVYPRSIAKNVKPAVVSQIFDIMDRLLAISTADDFVAEMSYDFLAWSPAKPTMHWVNAISGYLGRRTNRNACTDTRNFSFPISDGGHPNKPDPTHPRRPDPPLPFARALYTFFRGLGTFSARLERDGAVGCAEGRAKGEGETCVGGGGHRAFRVEGV